MTDFTDAEQEYVDKVSDSINKSIGDRSADDPYKDKKEWETFYNKEQLKLFNKGRLREREKYFYIHEWAVKHIKPGNKVLDVGCGDGELLYLAGQKGALLAGVDVSVMSVSWVNNELGGMMAVTGYAENLPYDADTFDVVTCTEVLEHLPNPKRALKELLRVLRPGGKLIVSVPINDNFNHPSHLNQWDLYKLNGMFEKYGDDFKIYYLNKFHHFIEEYNEPAVKNLFGVVFVK